MRQVLASRVTEIFVGTLALHSLAVPGLHFCRAVVRPEPSGDPSPLDRFPAGHSDVSVATVIFLRRNDCDRPVTVDEHVLLLVFSRFMPTFGIPANYFVDLAFMPMVAAT
jgi:hypothetical protein